MGMSEGLLLDRVRVGGCLAYHSGTTMELSHDVVTRSAGAGVGLWQGRQHVHCCEGCCPKDGVPVCTSVKRRGHPHPTPYNDGPKKRPEPAGVAIPRSLYQDKSERTRRRYVSTIRVAFNSIANRCGRGTAVDSMAAFIEAEGKDDTHAGVDIVGC